MDIFKGQNLLEFSNRFKTDNDCKEYLAGLKDMGGYECLRCGHTAYQKRKDLSRVRNLCSHIESATANTLFHKVKFCVRKAFFICFEMATSTRSLSASYKGVRYGVTVESNGASEEDVKTALQKIGFKAESVAGS